MKKQAAYLKKFSESRRDRNLSQLEEAREWSTLTVKALYELYRSCLLDPEDPSKEGCIPHRPNDGIRYFSGLYAKQIGIDPENLLKLKNFIVKSMQATEDGAKGSHGEFMKEWGTVGGTRPQIVKRTFLGLRTLVHEARGNTRKPRKEIVKYLGDWGIDITVSMADEWLKSNNG